ncbi:MAG: hypothetical protein Q8P25_04050 [Candidatus Curtissbacteria bacterium]|nr:hypothetical protein [Candidatus Curtissbacteria bacterium]
MIKASAPGKIHLIGEYSAIVGKPAILFPINLSLTVFIQKTKTKVKKEQFQKAIELAIEKRFNIKIPNYSLKIVSNIPTGSGLGSSAALCASLSQALLKMQNIKASQDEIFQIALEGERVFHGFPSGSDLLTVIQGKILWYRKENPELIISIPLDIKISRKLGLFLIHSGTPKETTKQMVEFVLKSVPNKKFKQFCNSQEELTKTMFNVLKSADQDEFTRIIKAAHKNLATLGVISKSALEIVRQIEQIGGAAKITGAGGRKEGAGMIIAYHPKPEKLISLGYNLIKVK